MLRDDYRVAESMSALVNGHDFRHGVDLALSAAEWRSRLSEAAYIRRIGQRVLAFERRDGDVSLAFEIFDEGGAIGPLHRGTRR